MLWGPFRFDTGPHAMPDQHKTCHFCNKYVLSVVYIRLHASAHEMSASSGRWRGILRSNAVPCATPRTLTGVVLNYHWSRAEKKQEQCEALAEDGNALLMTSSSSESSRWVPLHHLLWFFELELESREWTLEDQPDDTSGKPPPKYNTKMPQQGNALTSSTAALHGTASGMECKLCESKPTQAQRAMLN